MHMLHGEWLWNTCATIYVPSYHPVSCLKVSPAPDWAPLCVKSPAGQTSETPWDRADGPLGVNLARSNFINFVIALLTSDNAFFMTVGKV